MPTHKTREFNMNDNQLYIEDTPAVDIPAAESHKVRQAFYRNPDCNIRRKAYDRILLYPCLLYTSDAADE